MKTPLDRHALCMWIYKYFISSLESRDKTRKEKERLGMNILPLKRLSIWLLLLHGCCLRFERKRKRGKKENSKS
jgi:hypothetical protein